MAEMIDRNRLLLEIESDENKSADAMQFERYSEMVKRQPAVDAVPVIRCKYCKHRHESVMYGFECDKAAYPYEDSRNVFDGDWFCADGERKDGGQDATN